MQEQTIFTEALEKEDPAERAAFLEGACAGDARLRQRVERLLGRHDHAGSFLEQPVLSGDATADYQPPISEQPGSVIGPYELLQQIGEGGFGVVFMAEQVRPVRRRVALKVIKPGMDTREVIARFEAERQALAVMDHPNIAKVFDAGATDNGRPYFVMELVQGVPITDYCDECQLTTRERLELFITVCQAVQHAHQKGIIHRDIKPSNVLVAMQDRKPAPKIIDFGVAKAVGEQPLSERTLTTAFAQMLGSPLYMSPEQSELSPLGVDTRSDIYSLGVLLYELLTGTTPFDKDRLRAASFDELRRIIHEEEPPRPSTRISTLAADLATTVAAHRRTDTRRLRQAVRGELDWIVMKCVEKDRNRRYESASSLARDIERYLNDETVRACPPSAVYRIKKFNRRNKVAVLAGSAVVAAIIAGLALATTGFVQARRQAEISAAEAAKATAISDLLQTALQSANPDQTKGVDYKVRQLLDDFSSNLSNQLSDQPDVESRLRAVIGNAYRRLGLIELAAAQFEAALALHRRLPGNETPEYAEMLVDYSQCLSELTRADDAKQMAQQAISIYRSNGTSGQPLVKALWILQLQLANDLRYAEEQAVVDEALAIAEANNTEYPELASMLHRHAPLIASRGRYSEAENCAKRAVNMHRRLHGDQHPETAYGLADLGRVLNYQKKYREAEAALNESLDIFRRYYGDDNSYVIGVRDELKRSIFAQGEARESEARLAPKDAGETAENSSSASPSTTNDK